METAPFHRTNRRCPRCRYQLLSAASQSDDIARFLDVTLPHVLGACHADSVAVASLARQCHARGESWIQLGHAGSPNDAPRGIAGRGTRCANGPSRAMAGSSRRSTVAVASRVAGRTRRATFADRSAIRGRSHSARAAQGIGDGARPNQPGSAHRTAGRRFWPSSVAGTRRRKWKTLLMQMAEAATRLVARRSGQHLSLGSRRASTRRPAGLGRRRKASCASPTMPASWAR